MALGRRLRRGTVAAAVVVVGVVAGCGEGDTEEAIPRPVANADGPALFAPQVRLAGGERFQPLSADRFLRHSGLEWGGGGCDPWDVTASGYDWPDFDGPLPQLDPGRLGPGDPYRVPRRGNCIVSPGGYTSDQQTRPFGAAGRPPGLRIDEGFNLDLADETKGEDRELPGADRVLRGVTAYYTRTPMTLDGVAGWRFSYWLLFAQAHTPERSAVREGDWERIDVLVRRGSRRGDYVPTAVDLYVDGRRERTLWKNVERVGEGSTHPVVSLESETHTPELSLRCGGCVTWSTWEELRDARHEPWWGYGGGWGEIGVSDASSGAAGPSPRTADAAASTGPPATFAPEVQLAPNETLLPVGAARFLLHSGLEWAGGGCGDRNITESGWGWPEFNDPQEQLDPSRLGPDDPYRARSYRGACLDPRGPGYRSDQQTRPFSPNGRPPGLRIDEGFNLDLASIEQGGGQTTVGDLARIPAYFTPTTQTVGGRPGVRLSYWLLFPIGRIPRTSDYREGDWERIDVILGRPSGAPGSFQPAAVEVHAEGRRRRVPWSAVTRAGQGSTHPVVRLDGETHTPRLARRCASCPSWRVWNRLRDARHEPWWGYGGGWGEIGDSDASSGAAGPSPYGL